MLQNHLINGTVVYSTEITANTTAVSAAGETISFEIMDGQVMVVSGGQAKAKVVRTDIPSELWHRLAFLFTVRVIMLTTGSTHHPLTALFSRERCCPPH